MKLYWAPKTRSFTTLWMAEESGLPYELEKVDWRGGGLATDLFKAINPMMKIPALTDGALRMAETGAICAYLAERPGSVSLAPALDDPRRGRYWQWLFFAGNCIEPAMAQIFAKFELPSQSAGWGNADRVFAVLEETLAGGPWILGEQFCAADVTIGAAVIACRKMLKLWDNHPVFDGYIARCEARPAYQRARQIEATE